MGTYYIDLDSHYEIHRELSFVPIPDIHMLGRIASNFVRHNDPIKKYDLFLSNIEEAIDHPRATSLEQEVGRLTLLALEIQRPYLVQGLISL